MKPTFIILIIQIITFQLFAQPDNFHSGVAETLYSATVRNLSYRIGDRNVAVKVLQYGEPGKLVCINLHDNEGTSVEAAKSVLQQKGGTIIKFENNNQRIIRFRFKGISYGIDPNRIFSRIGIEQTLKENHRFSSAAIKEVEKFAQQILNLFPDSTESIVALHNNTDEAFSIRSYLPGGNRQNDAKAVFADSLQDVDDIILTTDSLLFQKMADSRYNSIWQDNMNVKKDGSLSVYFGTLNKRYINIETQHGKVAQYVEMLEKLIAILKDEIILLSEISADSL